MSKVQTIKRTLNNAAVKAVTKEVINAQKLDRSTKRHITILGKRMRYKGTPGSSWRIIREKLGIVDSNIKGVIDATNKSPQKKAQSLERIVAQVIVESNPFADKDGAPEKGEELNFFEWAEKSWNRHLETLSEGERQKHLDAAISLSKK